MRACSRVLPALRRIASVISWFVFSPAAYSLSITASPLFWRLASALTQPKIVQSWVTPCRSHNNSAVGLVRELELDEAPLKRAPFPNAPAASNDTSPVALNTDPVATQS